MTRPAAAPPPRPWRRLPQLLAIAAHGAWSASLRQEAGLGQAAAAAAWKTKIINGTVVPKPSEKYPFYALPTMGPISDVWLGCGASIISPTFGLTSAHCFGGGDDPCSGPKEVGLWVGDVTLREEGGLNAGTVVAPKAGGRYFRVQAETICHPKWDGKCAHGNDLVLLRLSAKLPAWVRPVPVDTSGMAFDGQIVKSIGFGLMESPKNPQVIGGLSENLREVSLKLRVGRHQPCENVYAGGYGCSDLASEAPATNRDQQLCAGNAGGPLSDTCSGDSGSPVLSASGVQIGVVSYGGGPGHKVSGPGRFCGDPTFPGIYMRISAMKDFIMKHAKDVQPMR